MADEPIIGGGQPWEPIAPEQAAGPPPGPPSGPPPGPATGPPPGPPTVATPMAVPPGGAPPAGGSPAYGGDLPPQEPDRNRNLIIAICVLAVLLLVGGIAIASSGGGSDGKAKDEDDADREVFLEASAEPGPDPYTASVAAPAPPPATSTTAGQVTTTTALAVPPPTGGNVRSYTGGQPGLYGGTRNYKTCDPEKMVSYLEGNPSKRAAWAKVQGISPSEVASYIRGLTPVTLRTDTWVLNHGYSNGRATERAAVLQAGTAVLVDEYGVPRAKCFCGNPLLPVERYDYTPRYRGTRWPGFNPQTVVIIQQSTTVINNFTLIDPYTGTPFDRPPGTNGTGDVDTPGTATTTAPPTTTSAPSATTTLPGVTALPPDLGGSTFFGIDVNYQLDIDNVTGTAKWTSDIKLGDDSGASGTGTGNVFADGSCKNTGSGQVVSTFYAEISFDVKIEGVVDGGYLNGQVTRTRASLDVLEYSNDAAPEVEDCRAQAESTYAAFVDKLLGEIKIKVAVGTTAPFGDPAAHGTAEVFP